MYGAAWALCGPGDTIPDCQTANGQLISNTSIGSGGGTSAAAPAFAGMLALVAQAHGSPSDNYRLGEVNNILYQLAQSGYSTVFHDITIGNNSVPCATGSPDCGSNLFLSGYNAGPGYDLASGFGSVDVAALIQSWTSVSFASTSMSLDINGSTAPYTGVEGQTLTFSVNVSPTTAAGLVAIVDNADEVSGGVGDDGQITIPISDGTGSATYNGLPVGSYTVWARYGGDTANASSTSSPPLEVTITGITLSSSGTIQVSPGATSGNMSVISVTPVFGFAGTVNLSCAVISMNNPTNDPPGCSLSSTAVNITGTAAVTSTLTVSTTAATTTASMLEPFRIGGLTALLAVVFWFGVPGRRNPWLRMLVIAITLAVSTGAVGCGGRGSGNTGGGYSGTSPGSYSVIVTATDATAGTTITQTTVNVIVNPLL
jgi:trimeric autotransporter adhesin